MKGMELLNIKGMLSDLPADDLEKIEACAAELRANIAEAGKHGPLALALISAEFVAKEEGK
jgi:hypothetical protein